MMRHLPVIPAKAGIAGGSRAAPSPEAPAFAGGAHFVASGGLAE